jgi:hypothetical protein
MIRKVCAAAAVALAGLAGVALGAGTPFSAVEGQGFSAPVATVTSSATANERFVEQAYLDILHRDADHAALVSFTTFLGGGGTRQQVASALLASDEYRTIVVNTAYKTFLRRSPDTLGLQAGVALLKGGGTDEQLEANLLGSAEYFTAQGGGTNAGFLAALFQDVLGRMIDPSSQQTYLQALSQGTTRTAVALSVLTSTEGRQVLGKSLYQQFLHRAADPVGLQTAVNVLAGGGTDEDVIALLVGSSEYFAKVPASFASATIDWGDHSAAAPGTVAADTVSNTLTISGGHTYADEGTFTTSVVVSDLDGTITISGLATVADAPLSATPVSFAVRKKTPFTHAVAQLTDQNPGAPGSDFTATIDWGDGSTSLGTVGALATGGFAVAGSHEYKKKGSYSVVTKLADRGGSTVQATSAIQVGSKKP